MGKLVINNKLVTKENALELVSICPFNAIEYNGELSINAGCKTCRLCVKRGPSGVITYIEDVIKEEVNKDLYHGVCVFIEPTIDSIHEVSYELIGKARELVSVTRDEVLGILIANNEIVSKYAKGIINSGCDKLYTYVDESFTYVNTEVYSKIIERFVNEYKPSVILFGGTPVGRSLAPLVARTFKTGLTADCTSLGMKENSDLIQVRPAFGGNVMASILCTRTRPQLATVRPKVFKRQNTCNHFGTIINQSVLITDLTTRIKLIERKRIEQSDDISKASIIVAIGSCFNSLDKINKARQFAKLINATLACSRPLVEQGLMDSKYQIGLSGKSVQPRLIINLGISGAIQYISGMSQSDTIISINTDKCAPIFNISNYLIIEDAFAILDKLITNLSKGGN